LALYQSKSELKERIARAKKKREEQIEEACTFHPKINPSQAPPSIIPVEDRLMEISKTQKFREKEIREQREREENDKLKKECTFTPKINKSELKSGLKKKKKKIVRRINPQTGMEEVIEDSEEEENFDGFSGAVQSEDEWIKV
jgi:hypothetical protein